MFTVDLTKLPSSMNNMAGSALKRISAAVGYNMTCSSQEKVEKQLPEGRTVEQKPLQDRVVFNVLSQKTIRRKIKEGRARKQSWHPGEILRSRWIKMSSKEQEELVQNVESFVTSGAIQACDWLTWNVPKYGISMIYLMLSGEIPDYAEDAMKACDLMRDMERR